MDICDSIVLTCRVLTRLRSASSLSLELSSLEEGKMLSIHSHYSFIYYHVQTLHLSLLCVDRSAIINAGH